MKESENDDDPFIPSTNLKIPLDMECPKTIKLNQIMEKTAKFIASQGSQMEILLKTKQAGNPQFNFLNHDDQLNAYYKHILMMMRSNTYPWEELSKKDEKLIKEPNEKEKSVELEEMSTIVIPKLQYKPSADCAYTQLISKITKAPISELEKKKEDEINKIPEAPKISGGLLGLVQNYNSDSESEQEEDNFNGKIPPPDIQIVIDKTASYVAKNGNDFEQKLICKNDARFNFLSDQDEYNEYYKMKVRHYLSQYPSAPKIAASEINISAVTTKEILLPKVPPAPIIFRYEFLYCF
jgi:Surp module